MFKRFPSEKKKQNSTLPNNLLMIHNNNWIAEANVYFCFIKYCYVNVMKYFDFSILANKIFAEYLQSIYAHHMDSVCHRKVSHNYENSRNI